MAKGLIEIAIQLGSKLGANTSKFLGTRSNVSFLGSGPKDGMLFQKEINPESFATIGIEKVLPDIESSLAYAAGGKLDDFQLNRLIKNLKTMDETLNPTNVVDMGIDSLRAKSGIGERQLTEAASDVKSIDDATASLNKAEAEADAFSKSIGFPQATETSPLMSKLENRVQGIRDKTEAASGIMETVSKVDLPGKRAASREFLVNSLKVGDEASSTTLSDVMSAQDMKYIMEGGGGVMGDPIVLVQKYFGPRIAEMVPSNASSEEMVIFTRRVMNNVEDAKGFRPDEPDFDPLTAAFVDNLADGGRAGYKDGYSVQDDMGDYGANVGKTAAPGGGFEGDGGNNNNSPVVTSGGGGITDVVPASKRTQYGFNFKNMFPGGKPFYGPIGGEEEEENKVSKMTTAANTITNYEDYNTRNQKAADIAAAFAKKEKLYAKGGRAGYSKGGLAKILEL